MKRKALTFGISTLTVGTLLIGFWAGSAVGPSGYHLAKKVTLGGEGGWDYLYCDSKARRIYISRGTHVMVVDADSAAVVGDIPNTNGVHGIASLIKPLSMSSAIAMPCTPFVLGMSRSLRPRRLKC